MVFPVVMYGCESWTVKKSWVPKNWCFWTVVLEKTLESTLACKEIQSVHPKGSQYWIFIGRTDVEAEAPILWSPNVKNWLLGRKVMTNLDSIFKTRDITLPTKVHLVKAMVFQWSCMDMRLGLWRKLSTKELMLLNCGVGEDSWESLGLQGDPSCPF